MSGWEAGDLAVCVKFGPLPNSAGGISWGSQCPPKGLVCRVLSIKPRFSYGGELLDGSILVLEGGYVGRADRFKRIKPDTEGANEDDAAWLKDLLTKKVKA